MLRKLTALALTAFVALSAAPAQAAMTAADRAILAYDHIIVIVEENKSYAQILGSALAPAVSGFAKTYASATNFYAEVHPSEANYIALVAGDTFGIHDDDAWYCKPAMKDQFCEEAGTAGYAAHTIDAPSLMSQLEAAHRTWRGYFEDLPADWKAIVSPADATHPAALYAAKHNPFVNFTSVQRDPAAASKIVGMNRLSADLAATFPAFALVVPNQCNEMHGLSGPLVPADCRGDAVITRGDRVTAGLVRQIQASPVWKTGRTAIVITWDEDNRSTSGAKGCCGYDPQSPANFGGGHIATVVMSNAGPRAVSDPTPYNHYSLLRTIEDAFRLPSHLRHADDDAIGVVPMRAMF